MRIEPIQAYKSPLLREGANKILLQNYQEIAFPPNWRTLNGCSVGFNADWKNLPLSPTVRHTTKFLAHETRVSCQRSELFFNYLEIGRQNPLTDLFKNVCVVLLTCEKDTAAFHP